MNRRLLTASAFLTLAALPAFARSLNLSSENLVVRSPSETMVAALLTASAAQQAKAEADIAGALVEKMAGAQLAAWKQYGRGIDLSGWKFPGGRFDRAVMARIDLRGSRLSRANLDYANLIDADLRGARLERASLRYADLRDAKIGYFGPVGPTNLADADLSGADLTHALAAEPELRLAQASPPPRGTAPTSSGGGTATGPAADCANKPRTDFSRANLKGAKLIRADLTCAILKGVQMNERTDLDGTILTGADLCAADLTNADFSKAVGADKASFRHAKIHGTKLPFTMPEASLVNAYGREVRRAGAGRSQRAEPRRCRPDRFQASPAAGRLGHRGVRGTLRR